MAADIAVKLCDSVAAKLEGRVLGTFSSKFCNSTKKIKFLKVPIFEYYI